MMKTFDFTPSEELENKKKSVLQFPKNKKKKLRKEETNPQKENTQKVSKKSSITKSSAWQNIQQDFQKYFAFQKSKMLAYPLDREIEEDGCIHACVGNKSEYSYVLSVQGYNLSGLSAKEYNDVLAAYWALHKSYLKPFKEIYTGFPEKNKENQNYLKSKMTAQEDKQKNLYRQEELRKLQVVEKEFRSRQSFVVVYGDSKEDLEDNYRNMMESGGKLLKLKKVDKEGVETLFSLLNHGGKIVKESGNIRERTAPSSISFDYAKVIPVEGRYEAIMVVSSLATSVKRRWLLDFIHREHVDATTVDYAFDEKINYAKDISDSMEVLKKKYRKAKIDSNKDRFESSYQQLRQINNHMENHGEVIKKVTIRLLVSAGDRETLSKKVERLQRFLNQNRGHHVQVYSNMGFFDWSSRFVSQRIQEDLAVGRKGIERSALSLSLGFAHNQTFLHDPRGLYYGRTKTQGSVYLDLFTKTEDRLSYDIFISGTKGSGKSTLLKKLTLDNYMKDNFVYIFDKAREFIDLVHLLNGLYLSLDGSDGMINMLQVFPFGATDKNGQVDVWGCFNAHIKETINRFKNWIDISKDEALDLSAILRDFYQKYFEGKGKIWRKFAITDLPNEAYPTFDDLYAYIKSGTAMKTAPQTLARLEKLISNIVSTKRKAFVGHTTLDGILTRQVIAFDISGISDGDTGDFDILFHMSMTLLSAMAQTRGRKEKAAYENGEKSFEDIVRTLIIVDECHNILNPNKLQAVSMFDIAIREDRKFYYGLALATQLIETMLPANGAQMNGEEGQAIQKLNGIIGLCQYKAWMRQAETSIPTLKKYFSTHFKPSDYDEMPGFKVKKGYGSEMILTGTGGRSLEMYFYATPHEVKIFKGGA